MKNKKLIATVASLCLVLVAVVAAVVGVLAAASQRVSNNVSIKYKANDVYANVKAEAKMEGAENFTQLLTDANGVTFGRSETTERTANAAGFPAELSSNVKYVLYHLTFENLNTSYGMSITGTYKHYGIAPNGTPTLVSDTNVSAWYKWFDAAQTGANEPKVTYNEANGTLATVPDTTEQGGWKVINTPTAAGSDQVIEDTVGNKPASGTTNITHLYILVAITDLNADAQYLLGTTQGFFSENNSAVFYGNSLEFELTRSNA